MWNYEAYIAVCLIGIACNLISFLKINSNIGTHAEVRYLRLTLSSFCLYLFFDLVWALGEGGYMPFGIFADKLVSAGLLVSLGAFSYFWFLYVVANINQRSFASRAFRILITLPFLCKLALDISSIWLGLSFVVTEKNIYESGPLYTLSLVLNYIYPLAATVYSLYYVRKATSRRMRNNCLLFSSFFFVCLIAVVLANVFPGEPVVPAFLFFIIYLIILNLQDDRIYNDALTGLNNRRRLDEYLSDSISEVTAEKPLQVYICDINGFKKINDRYGHAVGDEALKVTASVIARVASAFSGFASRFGGDEFVLVFTKEPIVPGQLVAALDTQIAEACENGDIKLSITVGHAQTDDPDENPAAVMKRADAMLYEKKRHLRSV